MIQFIKEKLLAPLIIALVGALVHSYIDLQILKHRVNSLEKDQAELWTQANDQFTRK